MTRSEALATVVSVTGEAPTTPERERLLDLVVDHVLRDGVIDVSLSAIARGIGSNNRMLLYYFGSKEQLIDQASLRAIDRFPHMREMWARMHAAASAEEALRGAWRDLAHAENLPYLRLYFQRFGIALRESAQWQMFLERAGTRWVGLARDALQSHGIPEERAHTMATATIAMWRGLQLALLSGVDRDALDAAYDDVITGLVSA